jgi:hypothetical protein
VWSQRWWLSAVCLVVPACASSAEQENVMSDGGLAMSDPNEVHGFVTTSSDGPLAAATVTLDTYVDANTPGTTAGTTTSDSTGKYRFSNVTPGQYQIIVDWKIGNITHDHAPLEVHSGFVVAHYSNRTARAVEAHPFRVPLEPGASIDFTYNN